MEILEIGFYGREYYSELILKIDVSHKDDELIGFIFNSDTYADGEFSDNWVTDFNVLHSTFKLSKKQQDDILNNVESKPYLKELERFFNIDNSFKIKGNDLISTNEIIHIDSISRAKKLDNDYIEINIYGEVKQINFTDYKSLFSIMSKEEL